MINNINSNEDYIEADYVNIYFSLNPNNKFYNSATDIYVVGSFNDYELTNENKMIFDYSTNKFKMLFAALSKRLCVSCPIAARTAWSDSRRLRV